MKIALDLDGTLAKTYDVAFRLMGVEDEYSYEDIESWLWGFETFSEPRFLNSLWHSWTLRPHEIQPTEPPSAVSAIRELADTLDIVTANPDHLGIEESKRAWLDEHDFEYDELVISPMGQSKMELYDYDVFIDDSPWIVSEHHPDKKLFLYDAPYNQDVVGDYYRVGSLAEVYSALDVRRHVP